MHVTMNCYGTNYVLEPHVALYEVTDFRGQTMPGLAITLTVADGDCPGAPYGTLTVSFGKFIGMKNCAYIDTNNNTDVDVFLREGYAVDTGLTTKSGFCTYPLWQFNEDFLKAISEDTDAYEIYCNAYDTYMNGEPFVMPLDM